MTTWYDIGVSPPTDGATVWLRRGWFSQPFKATWSAADQTFTLNDGRSLPWWIVTRWREQ